MGIIRTFVNIIFGIIEFLLALRFIFEFFVVNSNTPFVAWVYGATAALVAPFAKIIPDFRFDGFVVDFVTLVALVVYVFLGYLISELFSYADNRYHKV